MDTGLIQPLRRDAVIVFVDHGVAAVQIIQESSWARHSNMGSRGAIPNLSGVTPKSRPCLTSVPPRAFPPRQQS